MGAGAARAFAPGFLLVVLVAGAAPARAQDERAVPESTASTAARTAPAASAATTAPAPGGTEEPGGLGINPQLAYWAKGPNRWFVSGMLDLGYLYLRPRFHAGYGRPHWQWIGLEVNPLLSGSGIGAYAGLRGAIPWAELRLGGRYFFSFQSSFLTPAAHYDHLTAQDRSGPSSRYLSLEAQLELRVALGPGSLRSEITGTYVALVDPGFFVQEQTLHVIIDPPWVWGADLGYRINFGPEDKMYIQPMAEIVHLVNRNEVVVRVGVQAGIQLWSDFEARLFVLPQIVGPDDLGAAGAQTFQLGLRWRFATDMPDEDEEDEEDVP